MEGLWRYWVKYVLCKKLRLIYEECIQAKLFQILPKKKKNPKISMLKLPKGKKIKESK